jgi:ABC-type multidrug transport system ATPase subunit/ABC-type multidrug transport system permease subunit
MNGHQIDPTNVQVRQSIAFVAQDDSLQVTATPREAIAFSARLRLSRNLTKEDIDNVTNKMVKELNLGECADTIVGGALIKGISGGERKRTSCAIELVTHPSLIMLDEPTSGLDYFNALELCVVLHQIAREGSSVLMTIHQPSSDIFTNTLDRLILLNKGKVMYEGRCADVPPYFAERGSPCPPHFNPADWVIGISQTIPMEELVAAGFFSEDAANKYAIASARNKEHDGDDQSKIVSNRGAVKTAGLWEQTWLLFLRELKNLQRNTHALKVRTGMTVLISLLIGMIFYQVAKNDFTEYINVQSTFGALLMALVANVFSTVLPSLVTFPEERPVFLREYSTNHYSVAAYFVSRFSMEILVTALQVTVSTVITYFMIGFSENYGYFWAIVYSLAMTSTAIGVLIGCSVSDPNLAIEFLPAVFMPQILFAGFFVPPDLLPDWLSWIVYIFPLTYSTRLALIWEFEHGCDGLTPNYCEPLLRSVDADPDDTWWYWIVVLSMFVVFRLLALLLLRRKASKFY